MPLIFYHIGAAAWNVKYDSSTHTILIGLRGDVHDADPREVKCIVNIYGWTLVDMKMDKWDAQISSASIIAAGHKTIISWASKALRKYDSDTLSKKFNQDDT